MKNQNVVALPSCIVTALRRACNRYFSNCASYEDFTEKVKTAVVDCMKTYDMNRNNLPAWKAISAYIVSYYNLYTAKRDNVSMNTIIANYAEFKKIVYYNCNDYGAFGDLVEVLTRLAIRKNINLAHIADIHVKRAFESDITSSKYGKMEVGTNGKSFNEPLEKLENIVYGVFSDDDKMMIFDTCINGDVQAAIDAVSEMMYCFTVSQFIETLSEKVGRAKKLKINSRNQLQIIYNDSMMNAFIKYMEGQDDIKTLADMIKQHNTDKRAGI